MGPSFSVIFHFCAKRCLAHPQVICANKETEKKNRNKEYKKEIAV